jgi:nitrate reductase gamma subunit
MSVTAWHVFSFGAIGVSLLLMAYRMWVITRLPLHLRWELAPIPHEKGKGRYGGSYLEEYEWWTKPLHRSHVSPIIYMVREILLLRGVWQHNRGLWPLSFSLHMGIYLTAGIFLLLVANGVLSIVPSPPQILDSSLRFASVFALGGYVFGGIGSVGLVVKRVVDSSLRPFSTISRYSNLLFLAAVFVSGGYSWIGSGDPMPAMSRFVKGLITLDSGMNVPFPLSLHIVISLLFVLYLPMTDMMHFVAKFFTFHRIRWNDDPRDQKMEKELKVLLAQPVTWLAPHVGADGERDWTDVVTARMSDEKKP